jgi:hypothetical protein
VYGFVGLGEGLLTGGAAFANCPMICLAVTEFSIREISRKKRGGNKSNDHT